MADNRNNRGAADRAQVNAHEDYEVDYLAKKFGVTADKVREVETKVGKSRAKIEEELKRSSTRKSS